MLLLRCCCSDRALSINLFVVHHRYVHRQRRFCGHTSLKQPRSLPLPPTKAIRCTMLDSISFLVPRGVLGWTNADAIKKQSLFAKKDTGLFVVLPGSLLACSAIAPSERELLSDRRGFFDHLKPTGLIRGVSRSFPLICTDASLSLPSPYTESYHINFLMLNFHCFSFRSTTLYRYIYVDCESWRDAV
jgi:hypothetical protein